MLQRSDLKVFCTGVHDGTGNDYGQAVAQFFKSCCDAEQGRFAVERVKYGFNHQ